MAWHEISVRETTPFKEPRVSGQWNGPIRMCEICLYSTLCLRHVVDLSSTHEVTNASFHPKIPKQQNRALHVGIKRSPYEAIFGTAQKIGLRDYLLPEVVRSTLETEEDLEPCSDGRWEKQWVSLGTITAPGYISEKRCSLLVWSLMVIGGNAPGGRPKISNRKDIWG